LLIKVSNCYSFEKKYDEAFNILAFSQRFNEYQEKIFFKKYKLLMEMGKFQLARRNLEMVISRFPYSSNKSVYYDLKMKIDEKLKNLKQKIIVSDEEEDEES
jgi:hypothetical protein